MSAFDEASKVEAVARKLLVSWIEQNPEFKNYMFHEKGELSIAMQKTVGDLTIELIDGTTVNVEHKAEQKTKPNNTLFLEIWSNRSRRTQGWMYTLKAKWFWYLFLDTRTLYTFDFLRLQEWAFTTNNVLELYPLKEQNTYSQLNDTWGCCVPAASLRMALIGMKEIDLGPYGSQSAA